MILNKANFSGTYLTTDGTWPNNSTGDITPADLRAGVQDLVDSTLNYWSADGTTPSDYSMLTYVGASGKWDPSTIQWDDLRFPLTRDRQGASFKPDFDFTNLGLLFPQNAEAEEINIIAQFPHQYKTNSPIHAHLHIRQTTSTLPMFKMNYKWYNNGDLIPENYTTISTSGIAPAFTYVSGSLAQIVKFPEISGTDKTISSIMDIRVYRQTGDGVSGDVLVKEFDIHYASDSFGGSRGEFVK